MMRYFILLCCLMTTIHISAENLPCVRMSTSLGEIVIELYPDKAPVSVINFLRYVKENRFQNLHFYRVVKPENQPNNKVKIEVFQGCLGFSEDSLRLPNIIHETTRKTGLKHLDGTISMARREPGSASSEFFICINEQPELDYGGKRNPDGQGFAAFGRVIKGMKVVREIQEQKDTNQMLNKIVTVSNVELIN